MRAKPVRSVLSLLGIYMGVLALVVIMSIGKGIDEKLKESYGTHGARVVFIQAAYDPLLKKSGQITTDDLNQIQAQPEVLSVMQRADRIMEIRAAKATYSNRVVGVDESFVSLYRVKLTRGRNFLKNEIDRKQMVCLISEATARSLFPIGDALDSTVVIAGMGFHVIGLIDWDSDTAQRTSELEVAALLPATWMVNENNATVNFAEVRVHENVTAAQSIALVSRVLSHGDAERSKLFRIRSTEQFMQQAQETANRVQASLLGIAAISLVVGAIGIANVMVISVTERTREIGTRKALGAKRMDILLQFLMEASVLSSSGGLLAVASGVVGVKLLPSFFNFSTPLVLPNDAVLFSLALTVAIGLIAGVYPASRAAQLSPAEALRYE